MAEEVKNRNTYGNIFKATALFSGVKVFQILISIIRSKLVAVLIGPEGMGIMNLYSSTIGTVNQLTGCGLQTSAVREVAKAYEKKEEGTINRVITILRFFVWLTGLLGTAILFFFSNQFSIFAFGSTEYSLAFKYLSINLLITQINTGQMALLQGTFHYKDIAKASLWGQIVGLVISIPIYYFMRERGIVPVLVLSSVIALFFSWIYSRRLPFTNVKMPLKELFKGGKDLMSLGIVLALGGLIGNFSSYVMNIFLSSQASLETVGLYGAGMTIANTYVAMVLSAMSSDYVPRIAALSGDTEGQIDAINKQIELVMLIMLPLIVALIVFVRLGIAILYSSDFYAISTMLQLFMVGMIFQALSWCLSYAVVARGDSKIFLWTELYNFVVSIVLKIVGYLLWGLAGIGIAFIIDYFLESLLIWIVCKRKFGFTFSIDCKKLIYLVIIASIVALTLMLTTNGAFHYSVGIILIVAVSYYSVKELNLRTGLFNAVKRRIR